ncbi:MAG TPA: outer membrane lipoprotein-sorting protein [Thermoanaerobaculia bacterium]|jgi:outer membrane lipoprotein-sorting protein
MRTRLLSLAVCLFAAASLFAADMTVDQIIAKNTEAKGGLDKMKSVQSVRFSGKMSLGPGMEAPFTMTKKRPEMMRLDFTVQGMTGSQAYDGSSAWMVMPFMGKKDPEQMSGDMAKDAKEQADFDGPFIDSARKGYKIELLGKSEVEGTEAYKLKLTKDGDETIVYVDADSFLEIKTEGKRKMQGQEIESETTLGNYREVNGMMFPFSMEMKQKGAPAGQTITIEKVEVNPTLGDDFFKMPVKKAEAEAPKK